MVTATPQNNSLDQPADAPESGRGDPQLAAENERKFWAKQPVFLDEQVAKNSVDQAAVGGALATEQKEIRDAPYKLPPGFEWKNLKMTTNKEESPLNNLHVLSDFICYNYVEDADNKFTYKYTPEMFNFVLNCPPVKKDYNICIFNEKVLVGFIHGAKNKTRVVDQTKDFIAVNFLCVHNKYRKHRLAPILIMELTRRANHDGIYQAIYTSGTKIHAPFTVTSYYHRLINRHKLVKCGFSPASYNKDMDKVTDKINEIKIQPGIQLVPVPQKRRVEAYEFVQKFMRDNYLVHPEFSQEQFSYYTKFREDLIETYCVLGPNKEFQVVLTFYRLSSEAKDACDTIKLAFLYYYAYSDHEIFVKAVKQLLYVLKTKNYDCLNCLSLGGNEDLLNELRFNIGTGTLNYFLYNFNIAEVDKRKVKYYLL